MGLPEEEEKRMTKTFQEITKTLNLDKTAAGEAWKMFLNIYQSFTVEKGDPVHWLGCAMFISCRNSFLPSMSRSSSAENSPTQNNTSTGNLASLSQLLKLIDLSLMDFFPKIRKCSHAFSLNEDFQDLVEKLERNFNVSMVLFRKFQPIFNDMFKTDQEVMKAAEKESNKTNQRPKKTKNSPPTSARVFEFTWLIFISLKVRFPLVSDDLVSAYHLLLACCDFIFNNVKSSERTELIRPAVCDVPCIITHLCKDFDGVPVEVKSFKEYIVKKHVQYLFEQKVLRGNSDELTEVLDPMNFEYNMKQLSKIYDEMSVNAGYIDERIFLEYSFHGGNKGKHAETSGDVSDDFSKRLNGPSLKKGDSPLTPLAGKKSNLKQLAGQCTPRPLRTVFNFRDASPGEVTLSLLAKLPNDVEKPKFQEYVEALTKKLSEALSVANKTEEDPTDEKEINIFLDYTVKLFYRLLDSILPEEVKKPGFDVCALLNQNCFITALYACSAELVNSSSRINKNFTWILENCAIPPFHFYKVIEVVVQQEDLLTREHVKHINSIEESIVESLAWKADSPLWKALVDSRTPIPAYEDVTMIPKNLEVPKPDTPTLVKPTPIIAITEKNESIVLQTAPGSSLLEKLNAAQKTLKRSIGQVMPGDDKEVGTPPYKVISLSKAGAIEQLTPFNQSRPFSKLVPIVIQTIGEDSTKNMVKTVEGSSMSPVPKPKKVGSVGLFFRKFYYLAAARLVDMCDQLKIRKTELRHKIWTLFEMTIVNHVGLMYNRHMDQLLLCSIYVICKIVGQEPSFKDMMKCYRNQPQAISHVYRRVLISPDRTLEEIRNGITETTEETRGDIINFYNTVFIHKVKELIRKFRCLPEDERIVLSPFPQCKMHLSPINNPKRLIESCPLFVRNFTKHDKAKRPTTTQNVMSYSFCQSPAQDLNRINNMICKMVTKKMGKQLLTDDERGVVFTTRKMIDLRSERMRVTLIPATVAE